MQFTNELLKLIHAHSFTPLNHTSSNIWGRVEETGNTLSLIYIIPEHLPGQPERALSEVMEEQRMLGNQLMLQTGKVVSWLTLMICADLPDKEQKKEIDSFQNIWCVIKKESKLLIYENQPGDFCQLCSPIESFLASYQELAKSAKKEELFRMFAPLTTLLVVVNVVIFLILSFLGDVSNPEFMASHGALFHEAISVQKEYYRFLSSMFIHFGADHLLQNMLILLLMGARLEKIGGKVYFAIVYMGSGLIASLVSFVYLDSYTVSGGASGAIFGVLGALLALLFKDVLTGQKKRIHDLGMTGMIFMIVSVLSYGFFETGVDNAAHIGGLIGGFLLSMILSLIIDRKIDK